MARQHPFKKATVARFVRLNFRAWILPLAVHLVLSTLMLLIGIELMNPVLQERQVTALLVMPLCSSAYILSLALSSFIKRKISEGICSVIALVVSLATDVFLFSILAIMGMSF